MKNIITIAALVFLFSAPSMATVELDADANGGVDVDKGGTNATTAGAALTALGASPSALATVRTTAAGGSTTAPSAEAAIGDALADKQDVSALVGIEARVGLTYTAAAGENPAYLDYNGSPTNSKAADYTIGTDLADEAFGGTIYVTAAATVTAQAVAPGHNYCVTTIGDIVVSLDVNAADKMILDGVTLADGDKATNSSKSGDTICCQYYSADGQYCWSGTVLGGHWTDGN